MAQYSIDQFSQITGIPKISLRTWENRYDFLIPNRTKTNIRVYTDEMLVKGINTQFLLSNKFKISQVSKMTDDELVSQVNLIGDSDDLDVKGTFYINKFLETAINFDEYSFHKTFDKGSSDMGIVSFYDKVLLPLLQRVGLLWLVSKISPSQEHFLSELIKQKLSALTDAVKIKKKPKKDTWLLFLPEREFHEIGLLFTKYLLIQNGYHVIYLGDNLPLECLAEVAQKQKAQNLLFFSISNVSLSGIRENISQCKTYFPKSKIHVVTKGTKLMEINSEHDDIIFVHNLNDFISCIK
jgi:methanogenic corrinoid protein MtbC1